MKKFLLGLIAGIVFCLLSSFVFFFALIRFGNRPPSISRGSTLVLNLRGDIPEKALPELPLPFLEDQSPLTLPNVWQTLRKASADPRIRALVFEPGALSAGWAKLDEVHAELQQFRKSGKPLYAYLRSPGFREYYLATAADRIYLAPEDSLDLKGLRLETVYVKDTLDKLGLKMDVIHAGKYKDAGDMFTRTSMSPETREVLSQVLDQFYGDLVSTIASGRRMQPDAVRGWIDQGPLTGDQAMAAGFIDRLSYRGDMKSDLEKRLGQTNLTTVAFPTYSKVPASSVSGLEGPNRIALVAAEGMIVRGAGADGFSGGLLTSGAFNKILNDVGEDSSIKGVILRVDSPGGDGVASDEMLNAARLLSKKKPLVISMSDYAASGGYYISMTGDPVVAYPNTITGSIGVVYSRLSARGLYGKLGIQKDFIQRGRFAGLDSDYAPLSPDEQSKISSEIDRFYHAFIQRVASGRKRAPEAIEPLAQGRVWLGSQAKRNGLVNELGGLDKAVEILKQRAGIQASAKITLVVYPARKSILAMLFNHADESPLVDARVRDLFGLVPGGMGERLLPPEVATLESAAQLWRRGGILDVMPYLLQVR